MNRSRATSGWADRQNAFAAIVLHAFQLRPAFRKAFLLCDIQGLTIAETASLLHISPRAVAIRLDRARREMNLRLRASAPYLLAS